VYWSVNAFNNSHSVNYYNTSTGSSMIAYLPYGTYNYTGNFNGVATPLHEFNVTGVSIAINVVFPEKYSVVFTETGLPTGTVWEVSVNNLTTGNSFNSSSTSTITFSLYNGSYTYNVTTSLSGWKPSSPSGKFIVPGSTVNVPTVTFSTTDHNVQFKESGMPTGTSWYVIFNGTEEISTSNNITFYIPNGNYTYTLQTPVPGSTGIRYVVSPSSGNVNVSGHNLSKNVSYSTQYHLTIDTSPAGTGTVSPSSSWFSAGSSVTLTAQAYSGYNFSSWSGSGTGSYTGTNNPATLTMSGPISETANFVQTTVYHYTTTFTESGLPSGTTWYVNLSNGFDSGAITGTSYSFSLANGSYSYTIATTDKTYEPSPSTGSFKVNAGPVSISVSFSDVKYKVTFKETGLPSGSSWNITFNGVTISSTNSTITFSALNGTYSFSASNSSSYYTVNYSGSISVKGNSVSTSIIYYHYAYISGTVNPSNATVDINGHSVKVTGSGSFNVSEASGTYSIVISESGYSTYYSNVTLTAGQTKELNVTLNPVKSPATPSIPPLELYGIVGAMVAIVAVVAVVSLMRKKH
ncbi:MAG: PEGA domain-containing protein, partial [Candidatus Thermoplasmatota archaeon]|nr:PEGA domain-containing protein [Candidatus Thermoplasmatota archaeon]